MARHVNETKERCFSIDEVEYRLIKPNNLEELVEALEVKSAIEKHVNRLVLDEESHFYNSLLEEQLKYIKQYLDNLGDFDNSFLIGNINYFLRKLNLRMGELEQIIGISAGYISRTAKENAAKKLSIDVVWKLSQLFGVDVKTLIETDLNMPTSNTKMVLSFLDKLCRQTVRNEIMWENHGGTMNYLDKGLGTTGLFSERENGIIRYKPKDHLNTNLKYVLVDDVYICPGIAAGKDLAMIGFSIADDEDSYLIDFLLLSKIGGNNSPHFYTAETAICCADDPHKWLQHKAEDLMELVQRQEIDAHLSPDVKNIIANYLK